MFSEVIGFLEGKPLKIQIILRIYDEETWQRQSKDTMYVTVSTHYTYG